MIPIVDISSSIYRSTPYFHFHFHFSCFLGLHLPWTQYFALIKTILKQLDRQKVEKEKVLLTALCSILDSFHFEFEGDEEADGMERKNRKKI